jgi:hypothetical protein
MGRAERNARRFARLIRASGLTLPTERIKAGLARAKARDADEREVAARIERERFEGCLSVTDSARELGITRTALFRWLEDADWLRRVERGWSATSHALADTFVIERGPARIRWVQLTPRGREEIAHRMGSNGDAKGDE